MVRPPGPLPAAASRYPPGPPEYGSIEEGSVTEVDSLLDATEDDGDTTLATIRRADLEPMLGAPPPEASPYYAPPPASGASPYDPPEPPPAPTEGTPPVAPPAEMAADVPPAVPEPAPSSGQVGVTPPYAQVDVRYTGVPTTPLVGGTPGVGAALGLKVKMLGGKVPLWLLVGLWLAITGVCCVALGVVLGQPGHALAGVLPMALPAASPAASSAASSAVSPSASSAVSPSASSAVSPSASSAVSLAPPVASAAPGRGSLLERASAGDPAALKELEGRPALDSQGVLALSQGRMMQRRIELEKLGASLKNKPKLAADSAVQEQLLTAVRDPETARVALRIMANLQSSDGPDLLYETWTGTRRHTETTELAEKLIHEKDVRARASPALAVALDLRDAKTCKENKKLLAAAKDHGDRRSLYQLYMLKRRFGCGPHKRRDCNKCLRGTHDLAHAIKAVYHRHGPKF